MRFMSFLLKYTMRFIVLVTKKAHFLSFAFKISLSTIVLLTEKQLKAINNTMIHYALIPLCMLLHYASKKYKNHRGKYCISCTRIN